MLCEQAWQNDDVGIGPKIPQVLEKILQLKEIRQEQLTATPTGQNYIVCNTESNKPLQKTKKVNTYCVVCPLFFFFFFFVEEEDDAADMDMNSSRPYSDDEEDGALSKKDVSFSSWGLFYFVHEKANKSP